MSLWWTSLRYDPSPPKSTFTVIFNQVIVGGKVAEPWSQYGGQQETILTVRRCSYLPKISLKECFPEKYPFQTRSQRVSGAL